MGFRINTNVAALNAQNSLAMNSRSLNGSLARLSSGLRINTAADDASGLAIADSLRAQSSSLGQAVSNGNDAIGLLQTADGALSEYGNILNTIKTKAIQAASDGQNTNSRLAIQNDINALMKELNNIAKTTSFNGQKLLSGTFTNKEFQMGANANQSTKVNIASTETSQIGQTTRGTLTIDKLGANQLTIKSVTTGKTITLDPIDLQFNNKASNGMAAVADQINKYTGETGVSANAVVTAGTGAITAGTTSANFTINGVSIGTIQVSANDSSGTLQNAINAKTTSTGVSATRTSNGQLTLTSTDGRALQVKNLAGVAANSDASMSTMGHLNVNQAGSSDFAITGAKFIPTAAGADLTLTGTTAMIQDSFLKDASTIAKGSILVNGTTLGSNISATKGMAFVYSSSTADMTLGKNSILGSASIISKGTTLSTKVVVSSTATTALTLSSSMLVAAGSILTTGTIFDAGTTLNQDFVVAGNTYKAGTVLASDLTLTSTRTLTKDMTMFVDLNGTANAVLGDGTTLAAGTILGNNVTTTASTTLKAKQVIKAGSVLASGSSMAGGTVLGQSITITAANVTLSADMTLKAGSSLGSSSVLKKDSTVGGIATINANTVLTKDMNLKAGSVLVSGTILKKGTILTQDLTAAQVNGGSGLGLKAGAVLNVDLTTTADIKLTNDLNLLNGSTLKVGSKIAANALNRDSVTIGNKQFTNLSGVDVTTLKGAMQAIDTLSAAITNLDTIRSSLGSAQNQVTSTINNISVTQVNVKAAESNIRDVNFAAESAKFSKFKILAQSGSYAMSQANAVQKNVLRLLQ